MKKTLLSITLLLLCSLVLFSENAKAAEKKSGKYRYEVLDKKKKTAAITHVDKVSAVVKIPKRIKGYTVVQLGRMKNASDSLSEGAEKINSVFSEEDKGKVKQIKLPATLRRVGARALKGCTNLKSIDFPEGLRYIGSRALETCNNVKKVVLPKELKSIGSYAFYRCTGLKQVIFKTNKAKVGIYAFATYSKSKQGQLKKIELPVTYKGRIMESAFCGYRGETFTWGNLTAANGAFFRGVSTLKKIRVHKDAKEVDIPRNCLTDSAGQLEIDVPRYVEKVYIGQQRYNIKQITIRGLDTALEGDYAMGIGNPHIMISVERVKCKRKSTAWDMASQYIYPDLSNVNWENYEEDTMYREDDADIDIKQVKLIPL